MALFRNYGILSLLSKCLLYLLIAVKASQDCSPNYQGVPNLYPNPDPEAPALFQVRWLTTQSSEPIVLQVTRSWSPLGVDRFYQLVLDDYYQCLGFFRVVEGFVAQFGIAAVPAESDKWNTAIKDDPVLVSNTYGTVSFASAGPDTRTTQIFISTADNGRLDASGFSPFALVISGMNVVDNLYNPTPGDSAGVDQDLYTEYGNVWLELNYPATTLIWSNQSFSNHTSSTASSSDKGGILGLGIKALGIKALGIKALLFGCIVGAAALVVLTAGLFKWYRGREGGRNREEGEKEPFVPAGLSSTSDA